MIKKRILPLMLCAALALCFFGCSKESKKPSDTPSQQQTEKSTAVMPTVLEPAEYVLYENIFYNEQGDDYDGTEVTKKGTFAILIDEYNATKRYYVWGYNDRTKCCDWQWEFAPDDPDSLPPVGSLVEVKGTFVSDVKALDGYWIINPEVSVTEKYTGADADVDMTTMSGTLERVEVFNLQQYPDRFEGKTVRAYGRVLNPTTLQHPYYDGAFEQNFTTSDTVPAIGTLIILKGTVTDGVIADCTVSENTQF
jgi:hypothetical protein